MDIEKNVTVTDLKEKLYLLKNTFLKIRAEVSSVNSTNLNNENLHLIHVYVQNILISIEQQEQVIVMIESLGKRRMSISDKDAAIELMHQYKSLQDDCIWMLDELKRLV